MSEGSLGKSLRASGDCDTPKQLADFADFADSYLLGPQHLSKDLTDGPAVLGDHIVDLSPEASPQRSGLEATVLSFWTDSQAADKNAADIVGGIEEHGKVAPKMSKPCEYTQVPAAEPMDSSDWDQTQERFGSQVGAQRPAAISTESPESVLEMRAKPDSNTAEAQRISNSESGGLQPPEGFLHRDGSSNALAQEQQLPHQGHSYSRLLSLGDEPGDALPLGRGGDPWEGRGSNNFHTSPFMSRMQASGMRSSMTGVETPHRLPVARGSWSSSDMPGTAEEAHWGSSQYQGRPLTRMMSEHVTPKRFTASPVKRQFSEDLQDAPRGSLEAILSASGTNPLDPMYGEADAGLSTFSQADLRSRGHRRSKSHGIPPQSPMNRGPAALYTQSQAGAPADGTRKRRRDLYQDPQPGVHQGRGRLLQEDLIGHLKQQIASLDQHTKSLMKMTLYRISRNANASADGMRESSQQNPRNAYLDKVVANFMYNRFSSRGLGGRATQAFSGSHLDSAGYFNRSCSSPEMNHSMAHQGLDMDP